MSHSKGLFAGTCPGNFKNYGRVKDDGDNHKKQQQKCGRCGRLRWKRVRKCWMFHQYRDAGDPKEGVQKQKCAKCADKRNTEAKRCGWFSGCSYHQCAKIDGVHCRRCGRPHRR